MLYEVITYMRKRGPFTYGAAVLAQGGMGTELGKIAGRGSGGRSWEKSNQAKRSVVGAIGDCPFNKHPGIV